MLLNFNNNTSMGRRRSNISAACRSELGLLGSNLLQVGDGELRESRIGRG
jgi:hypothetical protein